MNWKNFPERLFWTLGCAILCALMIWTMSDDPGFNGGQAFIAVFVFALIWGFVFRIIPK